jgi:hypothetical protein
LMMIFDFSGPRRRAGLVGVFVRAREHRFGVFAAAHGQDEGRHQRTTGRDTVTNGQFWPFGRSHEHVFGTLLRVERR